MGANIKHRVICICHSGGYAAQYSSWADLLDKDVDLVVYERPGIGIRVQEPLCNDWHALVQDVWSVLKEQINVPYILFGHSLGGSIAFELAKYIQKQQANLPICLVIGDREAPSCESGLARYTLDDAAFKQMLISAYNMNQEILENDELMELFLPALRSDFMLADTYAAIKKPTAGKVDCNIAVFRPKESGDSSKSHLAWQQETTRECKIIGVPGDHFFVFNNARQCVSELSKLFET